MRSHQKATRSLRSGGGLGHTRVTAWESHPGRYSFPGPDDPRVQLLAWGHRREGCSCRSSEDTPEPLVCRRPRPGGGLWPGGLGPRSHSALTLACVLLGKLTQALSLSFVTCTMASATGPTLACCEDLGRAKAVSCCLNWGSDEGEVTGGRAAAAGATCGTRAWCGLWSRAGKGQPWLCWGPGGVLEAFPGQMGEVKTRLPGAVRHLCTPSGSLIPSGPFPNP